MKDSRPSSPKSTDDMFKDEEDFSLTGLVNAAVEAAVATDKADEHIPSHIGLPPSSPPSKKLCMDERNAFCIPNVKLEPKTEVSSSSEELSKARIASNCSSSIEARDSKKSLALSKAKRRFSETFNSEDVGNDIKISENEERSFSRESTISPPGSPSRTHNKLSNDQDFKEDNAGK